MGGGIFFFLLGIFCRHVTHMQLFLPNQYFIRSQVRTLALQAAQVAEIIDAAEGNKNKTKQQKELLACAGTSAEVDIWILGSCKVRTRRGNPRQESPVKQI